MMPDVAERNSKFALLSNFEANASDLCKTGHFKYIEIWACYFSVLLQFHLKFYFWYVLLVGTLSNLQTIRHKMAELKTDIAVCRAFTDQCITLHSVGCIILYAVICLRNICKFFIACVPEVIDHMNNFNFWELLRFLILLILLLGLGVGSWEFAPFYIEQTLY